MSDKVNTEPEQEAVYQVCDKTSNWIDVSREKFESCLNKPGDWQRRTLYTHPSAEIERLRAENARLLSAGQALEADFSSYRREVEHKAEAFTQRAEVAEQKLAEIQALLRDISTRPDNPKIVKNWIEDFLSSTAQQG